MNEIGVSAYFKYDRLISPFYFAVTVDNEEPFVKAFTGSSDWDKKEVSYFVKKQVEYISITMVSQGATAVWVDDIDVKVSTKRDAGRVPVQKDSTSNYYSKIHRIDSTDNNLENLYHLGLIWGFLKYHHPVVAKAKYWDHELFEIMPKILTCGSNIIRDKVLTDWICRLGRFKKHKAINYEHDFEMIRSYPDIDWITNNGYSIELQSVLYGVLLAARTDFNYYVRSSSLNGAIFTNEKTYATNTQFDAGMRMLALYRYWNMVQYFYPYKHLIEDDWKNVLKEFVPKMIASSVSLKETTLKFVARINDTHAFNHANYAYLGRDRMPFKCKYVEDRVVVSEYINKEASLNYNIEIGDVVTKINNRSVEEMIDELGAIIPASNQSKKTAIIVRNFLFATRRDSLVVVFKKEDKEETVVVESRSDYSTSNDRKNVSGKIKTDVGYVYMDNINLYNINDSISKLFSHKGLIVDLRRYSSGTMYEVGKYLMPKPTDFVKTTHISIENPGLIWSSNKSHTIGNYNTDYYKGKIVILINEDTQSESEFAAMGLSVAPDVVVIGSQTAGANGNISQLPLVGGVFVNFSGIGVYYPDWRETQRIGIVPNIEVRPTINGIKERRDELVEKAIEVLNL